jgi:mono/diheme cytochrome c family protein
VPFLHPGHPSAHDQLNGLRRALALPRGGPFAFVALAILLALGLAGCSLSEDITPPPGLVQPADATTSFATELPPTAGPSATPEPVEPPESIDLQAGRATFLDHCAACHGELGLGDGELAAQLLNPPTAIGSPSRALGASRMVQHDSLAICRASCRLSTHCPNERWNVTYYALSLSQCERPQAAVHFRDPLRRVPRAAVPATVLRSTR